MNLNINKFVIIILVVATTSSCGGGGESSNQTLPPPPVIVTNPGGLWSGTIHYADNSNSEIVGVITEDGRGHFYSSRGEELIVTSVSSNNGNITLAFNAYPAPGTFFEGGYPSTTGTLTGEIVERTFLSGNWTLATGESGRIGTSYHVFYDETSSLDTLAGMWNEQYGVASIDPDGSFYMQDQLGCVFEGIASIIDASYNAYALSMKISLCGPDFDGQYEGLGYLDIDVNRVFGNMFVLHMNNGQWPFTTWLYRLQ